MIKKKMNKNIITKHNIKNHQMFQVKFKVNYNLQTLLKKYKLFKRKNSFLIIKKKIYNLKNLEKNMVYWDKTLMRFRLCLFLQIEKICHHWDKKRKQWKMLLLQMLEFLNLKVNFQQICLTSVKEHIQMMEYYPNSRHIQ